MKIQTLIAALTLTVGASAFAQAPAAPVAPKDPTATPRIDQRQIIQEKRIDQGIASGQLTPNEAAKMEKRQDKIAANEAAAKADGKVTKQERRQIKHQQDHASRAIKRQKHDGQKLKPVAAK